MSEDDAEDVVQLLHESLLDAFTTDTGEVDFGRKGGMSLAKQVNGMAVSRFMYVKMTVYYIDCGSLTIVFEYVGRYVSLCGAR